MTVSPFDEFILVSCQLIQQFVSFPSLDFVRGIFWNIFTLDCQFLTETFVKYEFHVALEERRERDMKKEKRKKRRSMWVKLDFSVVELNIYSQICVVPNLC